jgi:predicted choloylglycine hydrolase
VPSRSAEAINGVGIVVYGRYYAVEKTMQLTFEAISETRPGPKWQALFQRYWPAYQQWFLSRGGATRPRFATALKKLQRYMPELLPIFERLVELAGGDELAARFLSCYRPPPYVISCAQAALSKPGHNVLVRNYDFEPELNEGLILQSVWNGRRVIATSEFLWGVADGMNDAGLALSLAFGGRKVVGDGFGIPLILRYVLEVCDCVADAIEVLRRVPSHMAYNVTLLDGRGEAVTVRVAPDRPTEVIKVPVATNHQGTVEWAEHARFTATLLREQVLREHLSNKHTTPQDLIQAFLRMPLYNTHYRSGFGTLYTAVYRPDRGEIEWRWPDAIWPQSFQNFREDRRVVRYSSTGAKVDKDWTAANDGGWQAADSNLAGILKHALGNVRDALEAAGYPLNSSWDGFWEEIERTGRVPWEKLGTLWMPQSQSYCDPSLAARRSTHHCRSCPD